MPKKKVRLSGAALQVHKHLYRGDGVRDHRGEDRCGDCGLAQAHRVHQLDQVDPAAGELGRRITGEEAEG